MPSDTAAQPSATTIDGTVENGDHALVNAHGGTATDASNDAAHLGPGSTTVNERDAAAQSIAATAFTDALQLANVPTPNGTIAVRTTNRGRPRGRGRGRGRGRPRIRGIGSTTDAIESDQTPMSIKPEIIFTTPITDPPPVGAARGIGSGRGRYRGRGNGSGAGGSSRGQRGKRRHNLSDKVIKAADSDLDSARSHFSLSEDEYTPRDTATRSGRSIQKPTTSVLHTDPAIPVGESQAAMVVGVKRKRGGIYRKNPEHTVCKVCLRPHSPASNMIVFCDSCNAPYHRYCHHPPIEQVVVDVPEKEWFCQECETGFYSESITRIDMYGSGEGLSEDKKRATLTKLPASILVTLLLKASKLHPDIPIIPPSPLAFFSSTQPPTAPDPKPISSHTRTPKTRNYNHPSTAEAYSRGAKSTATESNESNSNNGHGKEDETDDKAAAEAAAEQVTTSPQRPQDDELESGFEDDPPARYPVPGFGLARTLPPESAHESFLVDGDHEVYTHLWQVDAEEANKAVYGIVGGGGGGGCVDDQQQHKEHKGQREAQSQHCTKRGRADSDEQTRTQP